MLMARKPGWLWFPVAFGVAAVLLVLLASGASGYFGLPALLPFFLLDLFGLTASGLYVSDVEPFRDKSSLFGRLVPRAPPSLAIT